MMRLTSLHINNSGHSIQRGDLVSPPDGRLVYDILCNHIIFNYTEIAPYFPADTVYVGIVREPFSQFISSFIYERSYHQFVKDIVETNPENPIEEYLCRGDDYKNSDIKPNKVMFNNRMSVDFGFPLQHFESAKSNGSAIDAFINDIDGRFNLVLVTELFDESVVLLRRLLGWKTEDIIYLKSNVFTPKSDSPTWMSRTDYPEHVTRAFASYASLDIALYKHFYQKLKVSIDAQPPEFHDEVSDFRLLQRRVSEMCNSNLTASLPHVFPLYEFSLSEEQCRYMQMNEVDIFTKAQMYMRLKCRASVRRMKRGNGRC